MRSRSGTQAPRTPISGGQIPSAGTTEQQSESPIKKAYRERNSEIEQLRALIKQLTTIVEANSKESRADSAAHANATRELSTHVQALDEKIEAQQKLAYARGSRSKS